MMCTQDFISEMPKAAQHFPKEIVEDILAISEKMNISNVIKDRVNRRQRANKARRKSCSQDMRKIFDFSYAFMDFFRQFYF